MVRKEGGFINNISVAPVFTVKKGCKVLSEEDGEQLDGKSVDTAYKIGSINDKDVTIEDEY